MESAARLREARLAQKASGARARRTPWRNGEDPVKLGEALRRAQTDGQFKEFCAAYRLHTRKAYELVRIAEAVHRNLLTPADVEDIGWTKAALVAGVTGSRRARQAVAYARKYTLPALVSFLRHDQTAHGRAEQGLITKSFHLTPAEAEELDAALRLAGAEERGGRMLDRSEPIMRIVRAFKPAGSSGRGRDPDPPSTGSASSLASAASGKNRVRESREPGSATPKPTGRATRY